LPDRDGPRQWHSKTPLFRDLSGSVIIFPKITLGSATHTITSGDLDGTPRLFQVGTCNHEFLAAYFTGTLDDIVQITLMDLLSAILSSKNWITKVDTDLIKQNPPSATEAVKSE
jgi:hypothetical protein